MLFVFFSCLPLLLLNVIYMLPWIPPLWSVGYIYILLVVYISYMDTLTFLLSMMSSYEPIGTFFGHL